VLESTVKKLNKKQKIYDKESKQRRIKEVKKLWSKKVENRVEHNCRIGLE
jgi:hypothetical protein